MVRTESWQIFHIFTRRHVPLTGVRHEAYNDAPEQQPTVPTRRVREGKALREPSPPAASRVSPYAAGSRHTLCPVEKSYQ